MKVIHLQTSKVNGSGNDGYPKIERKTVKLEDGKAFNDFVKRFKINGFSVREGDYPKVLKVINTYPKVTKKKDHLDQITEDFEIISEEVNEIEAYQKLVDAALKPVVIEKVESEDIKAMKAELEELKSLIKSQAGGANNEPPKQEGGEDTEKADLLEEAKDLGAKVDARMSIDTIKAKIAELKEA